MKNNSENEKVIAACSQFLATAKKCVDAGVDLSGIRFSLAGISADITQSDFELDKAVPASNPELEAESDVCTYCSGSGVYEDFDGNNVPCSGCEGTGRYSGSIDLAAAPSPSVPAVESRPSVPTNSVISAYVIRIGNRYFCGFDKAKRVKTAWSLAGAKLFLVDLRFPQDSKLIQAEEKLIAKNIKFDRLVVSLREQSK